MLKIFKYTLLFTMENIDSCSTDPNEGPAFFFTCFRKHHVKTGKGLIQVTGHDKIHPTQSLFFQLNIKANKKNETNISSLLCELYFGVKKKSDIHIYIYISFNELNVHIIIL